VVISCAEELAVTTRTLNPAAEELRRQIAERVEKLRAIQTECKHESMQYSGDDVHDPGICLDCGLGA